MATQQTSQHRAGSSAAGAYDPIAEARALGPRIRELAPTIEAARRLPEELVAELTAAGLFHLVVPEAIGGMGCDPVTASRAVEELAVADGSTAWCVMLAAQDASFSAYLPEEHARLIWGDGGTVAGTARPIGRAVAVEDPEPGYRVSGRWPFASGSSHATWFAGECVVYDGDSPRKDAAGNDVTRMVFVPRAEVTVHDTWYTTGLRGTASNDFSIEDAFVPEARGFQVLVSEPLYPSPLDRAPPLAFMNHGSHALGIARGALESAREIATTKAGWGGVPVRELPRIQALFAEATAQVESARTYLYATAGELWEAAMEERTDTPDAKLLSARVRLAASHAATSSVRAVDLLHGALATTAIFTSTPLERQFRDIHTAAAHVMIGPLTYEAAGRVELGLDAEFPFF